jgi:hypothetical protein
MIFKSDLQGILLKWIPVGVCSKMMKKFPWEGYLCASAWLYKIAENPQS